MTIEYADRYSSRIRTEHGWRLLPPLADMSTRSRTQDRRASPIGTVRQILGGVTTTTLLVPLSGSRVNKRTRPQTGRISFMFGGVVMTAAIAPYRMARIKSRQLASAPGRQRTASGRYGGTNSMLPRDHWPLIPILWKGVQILWLAL